MILSVLDPHGLQSSTDGKFWVLGSAGRPDFTTIGPAVNLTARLETLGRDLVAPMAFARHCPEALDSLGSFRAARLANRRRCSRRMLQARMDAQQRLSADAALARRLEGENRAVFTCSCHDGVAVGALRVVLLLLGLIQLTQSTEAQDKILLRQTGTALRGGHWSFVRDAQEAISTSLSRCGADSIDADGTFGRKSRAAVTRLGACPGFGNLGIGDGEPTEGVLTVGLWTRLLPDEAAPNAVQRAHVLWLTHENTDYDTIEFNFTSEGEPQPNDPRSYLTWGPFGATVGHGREVQQILRRPEVAAELPDCFGRETENIGRVIDVPDAEAGRLVRLAFLDLSRREAWLDGFRCLGSRANVRAAYDAFALGEDTWLGPSVRRLEGLISPNSVTEIDFAFFVDLAMHMSITRTRVDTARQALDRRARELDRDLSASERRRTIGQTLVSLLSNQVEDRRGRNVVYYIDGMGIERLSRQEIEAWRHRSNVRATDVGLLDIPLDR